MWSTEKKPSELSEISRDYNVIKANLKHSEKMNNLGVMINGLSLSASQLYIGIYHEYKCFHSELYSSINLTVY